MFVVEVPDEWIQQRAVEFAERHGEGVAIRMGRGRATGEDYLLGRARDIADDELPLAFFGWPVEVTVTVEPSP